MTFTISLTVQADEQSAVRDLANGIQAAIRSAQRQGRHVDVEVVSGPLVTSGDAARVVD